jgi:hypothetical protein
MLLQFVVVPYMLNPYVYDLLPSKHFEVLILELLEQWSPFLYMWQDSENSGKGCSHIKIKLSFV